MGYVYKITNTINIGLTQVALLYHRLLACALRKPLFFESLPANGTSYRQNCVSPVTIKPISVSLFMNLKIRLDLGCRALSLFLQ